MMFSMLLLDGDMQDLGLPPTTVILPEPVGEETAVQFCTEAHEGKICFAVEVTAGGHKRTWPLNEGGVRLKGAMFTVDVNISATVKPMLEENGPCPECFGTGFKGGFQVACSRGCLA